MYQMASSWSGFCSLVAEGTRVNCHQSRTAVILAQISMLFVASTKIPSQSGKSKLKHPRIELSSGTPDLALQHVAVSSSPFLSRLVLLLDWLVLAKMTLEQGLAHFSVKGQIINTFGFAGHAISGATIQLCH